MNTILGESWADGPRRLLLSDLWDDIARSDQLVGMDLLAPEFTPVDRGRSDRDRSDYWEDAWDPKLDDAQQWLEPDNWPGLITGEDIARFSALMLARETLPAAQLDTAAQFWPWWTNPIPDSGASLEGVLVRNMSPAAIARAQRFEAAFAVSAHL